MKVETIRQRLSGPGPFTIRTSNGHAYHLPHTDFALVARYNILIEEEDGGVEVIDARHVVAIRNDSPPKGSHGGSRRAA